MKESVVCLEPVAVRRQTAAKMLDCSPTTVWQLARKGFLKVVQVGADDRITTASIRRYARQRTLQPAQLKVGDQAPPFTLVGSDGRTYRLADYRGKQVVVLAWFAKAFTSG